MSTANGVLPPLPSLSVEQQALLLAALETNRRNRGSTDPSNTVKPVKPVKQTSTSSRNTTKSKASHSPQDHSLGATPHSTSSGPPTFGDGYVGGYFDNNTNFDVDFPNSNGDYFNDYASLNDDATESPEGHEKRKLSIDSDSEDDDDFDGKRHEGDDKHAKKPGRKLITTEPTTKRKAQNRAAQRAFRERKERHVKDLEVKVADLEKVSETKSTENTTLRAQIERLQTELKDYKKRMSMGGGLSTSPNTSPLPMLLEKGNSFKGGVLSDFEFDFSRFGNASTDSTTTDVPSFGTMPSQASTISSLQDINQHSQSSISSVSSNYNAETFDKTQSPFAFQPGFFNGSNQVDYSLGNFDMPSEVPALAHSNSSKQTSQSQCASTAESPCSSAGMNGTSSSGTSPEPVPNFNTDENSKTFADLTFDSSALFQNQFPGMGPSQSLYDFSGLDWLSQQNGGQFEPQLFNDYRESQAAVVGDDAFNSGLFDEPYSFNDFSTGANDFNNFSVTNTGNLSPFVNPAKINGFAVPSAPVVAPAAKPAEVLLDRVNRCREGETGLEPPSMSTTKPGVPNATYYTTQKLWTELQTCPKFLSGDLDIDTLCSELSAKATCSETGMQVPKDVVEKVLWRLAGVPDGADHTTNEQLKVTGRAAGNLNPARKATV